MRGFYTPPQSAPYKNDLNKTEYFSRVVERNSFSSIHIHISVQGLCSYNVLTISAANRVKPDQFSVCHLVLVTGNMTGVLKGV